MISRFSGAVVFTCLLLTFATVACAQKRVTFPSGLVLVQVAAPTAKGQEHYDPNATGNAVLDVSGDFKKMKVSKNFTVAELTKSGGKVFDKARIDVNLVKCLQKIREHTGKPVIINSGYRSFAYNKKLYEKRDQEPTRSRHISGQAADIRIKGMTGMEIAKAAIDAYGKKIGIGIGSGYAHIDVRGSAASWSYAKDKAQKKADIDEIEAHRKSK